MPELEPVALKAAINEALKDLFGLVDGSVLCDLFCIDKTENVFIVRVASSKLSYLTAALFFRSSYRGLKCKFEILCSSPFLVSC